MKQIDEIRLLLDEIEKDISTPDDQAFCRIPGTPYLIAA